MRAIINYFRSLFCKHDFKLIFFAHVTFADSAKSYYVKTYRCKKCGYERKYKCI